MVCFFQPKDEYYSGEPYIPADIKPDLRNLDAISADVSSKEKILEESLHLNDVILSFRKTGIKPQLNHSFNTCQSFSQHE